MELFLVAAALAVGGLLAVQGAANLQLSSALGSPVGASTLQLGIAAVLLVALAAAAGTLTAVELLPRAEPWHLLGGLASALYITAGILLFPRLGALASVGLFVTGQLLVSVTMDALGLLGVRQVGLEPAAVAGAVAAVAGMALIVRAQAPAGPGGPGRDPLTAGKARWVLLGLAAGAALPLQGAINAQLRADLDAPITAGAFSFVVATATMAAVLLTGLRLHRTGRPRLRPLGRLPWWGWLGGVIGPTYVVALFLLLPQIGAAATIGLTVAGQQLASVLVDQRGLLRLPRRPLTRTRLAGLALLLAGVALIQLT
ncbi:MAG TPA: DMT family transporter [Actinomycetes bacterium]|jgi:transporter family-2 protein|nr:DMT family transporter [Actinomycetes bacterium]